MGVLFVIFLVLYFIGSLIKVFDEYEYKNNKRKAARYAVQKYENEKNSQQDSEILSQDAEIEKLEKEAEILRLKKEIEELKNKTTMTE